MHDTPSKPSAELQHFRPRLEELVLQACGEPLPSTKPTSASRPGRPVVLDSRHLWMALLLSVLSGMQSYQDLWRTVRSRRIGSFQPLALTDDAIVKRLQHAGVDPLLVLFHRISHRIATFLQTLPKAVPDELAPFASKIVALDETTWDAVHKHLTHLRHLPDGDPALLPGKLAARFDVRLQQWEWLQFRPSASANCKVQITSFLHDLPLGSLLLFDLGYFSFPWFDYLTQMQYWFITRYREKTVYQLVHTFYRQEGILDALVWMGSRSAHTGHLLRLVRYSDGKQLRMYVTNVLDPRQLSLPDIARLYARRWDIELAFLTLKEHLDLHHWWSGHPVLMQQQAIVVLIVAQLVHAMRMQIAAEAGVDPFEVSLPLFVRMLPHFLRQQEDLVAWVLDSGRQMGFLRPSSRLVLQLPDIPVDALSFPDPPPKLTRLARYVEYVPTPKHSSRPKKKSGQASNLSP